jgi:hypothetical protein
MKKKPVKKAAKKKTAKRLTPAALKKALIECGGLNKEWAKDHLIVM